MHFLVDAGGQTKEMSQGWGWGADLAADLCFSDPASVNRSQWPQPGPAPSCLILAWSYPLSLVVPVPGPFLPEDSRFGGSRVLTLLGPIPDDIFRIPGNQNPSRRHFVGSIPWIYA